MGAIDLLAGGTPCQSFSVAGNRAGLDDPRGNLTIEFARLAGRLRPLWLVWENVPGVLSIDGGRTFGAFLGILVELGYRLVIPIAAYVSAQGTQIEGTGVTPDISIPWSFEDGGTGSDSQLQGAIEVLHAA